MNIKQNLSPNFSKKTRSKNKIKFVIIHYTGMQSMIESINRLKEVKFKVSCHYLIKKNGEIIRMVEDRKEAWHAGKSKWKNFTNLNKNSIGIELVNKGHEFGYEIFPNKQIKNLIILCKDLKKKYKIKKENFLGHSDVAPSRKIDPGEKFPWKKLSVHNLGVWYKKKKLSIKFKDKKKVRKIFFYNLHKIGYRYFSLHKSNKNDYRIIRVFQQKYLPRYVTGEIDKKTFIISCFLAS